MFPFGWLLHFIIHTQKVVSLFVTTYQFFSKNETCQEYTVFVTLKSLIVWYALSTYSFKHDITSFCDCKQHQMSNHHLFDMLLVEVITPMCRITIIITLSGTGVPTSIQLANKNKTSCSTVPLPLLNKPVYIYTNMSIPRPATNHCPRNELDHVHTMECSNDHKISPSEFRGSSFRCNSTLRDWVLNLITTKLNYSVNLFH